MGWAVGFDQDLDRFVGYGVPAYCDHPDCTAEIDRGLSYICGEDMYGGDDGCGLCFCSVHRSHIANGHGVCEQCAMGDEPFDLKPEHPRWVAHLLFDSSWARWRSENPHRVGTLRKLATAP